MNNPDDISIEEQFSQAQNKNPGAEILRELFDKKKIFLITDLSTDEIRMATRIFMIAQMKNIGVWKDGLSFYLELCVSRDRKSRKELVDAMKNLNQQPQIPGQFGGWRR